MGDSQRFLENLCHLKDFSLKLPTSFDQVLERMKYKALQLVWMNVTSIITHSLIKLVYSALSHDTKASLQRR